jgi:2-polyprenyl-3-methyl-5-hydroxy-6-metoxy-1,4-benzoquinol methylase
MKNDWFASWFDTSYYHILYADRNDNEAKEFIINLSKNLNLPAHAKVLDLACGKGRHSVTLNELGFNVLGVDLSANSISEASKNQRDGLLFDVHDMREVLPNQTFDAVFNLFTSFGYFDKTSDNSRVLSAVHTMLAPQGILVIDFMNATKVINSLVTDESKTVQNIEFQIHRKFDGKHIYKNIKFEDEGEKYDFTERVQALKHEDFEELLEENNFGILRTFGDFNLSPFDKDKSDRLIIIAQRR